MKKIMLWASLVALLGFLAVLGLFCLSASAGGAVWGSTSYGWVFFIGCVIGCIVAIAIFCGVASLLTDIAKEENANGKTKQDGHRM